MGRFIGTPFSAWWQAARVLWLVRTSAPIDDQPADAGRSPNLARPISLLRLHLLAGERKLLWRAASVLITTSAPIDDQPADAGCSPSQNSIKTAQKIHSHK